MSPALSDLPVRKVIRALESSGFTHARTKGSHAIYRNADGRAVVIPQHGTIKRGTLSSIIRQAGLTTAEFLDPSLVLDVPRFERLPSDDHS